MFEKLQQKMNEIKINEINERKEMKERIGCILPFIYLIFKIICWAESQEIL